jgi:hypothetical protein
MVAKKKKKTNAKRTAKPAKRAVKKTKPRPKARAKTAGPLTLPKGYYVLAYYTPLRGTQERALFTLLRHAKDDPFRSWWDGAPFATAPHVPIQLVLGSEGGRLIPEYTEMPLPIMSARLLAVLLNAGVMNLQVYEVDIRDPSSSQLLGNHVAFNVMDKVALDDLRAVKPMLTRLDDGQSAHLIIVVNDVIKQAIEAAGIGMTFHTATLA